MAKMQWGKDRIKETRRGKEPLVGMRATKASPKPTHCLLEGEVVVGCRKGKTRQGGQTHEPTAGTTHEI